jgi:hypothetical protein
LSYRPGRRRQADYFQFGRSFASNSSEVIGY